MMPRAKQSFIRVRLSGSPPRSGQAHITQEGWCAMEDRDDGLGAARGCLYALPAGLLAWAGIIWAVRAVLR